MASGDLVLFKRTSRNSTASHVKSLPDPDKYPGPLRENRFSRRASGPESIGWRCRDAGPDSLERGHGRLEKRTITVSSLLGDYSDFPICSPSSTIPSWGWLLDREVRIWLKLVENSPINWRKHSLFLLLSRSSFHESHFATTLAKYFHLLKSLCVSCYT
jgi:hypothetical protein